MSGGHFDYKQFHISNIADEVEHLILNNTNEEKNEWGGAHYSPDTIAEFKKALHILRQAYVYAQRIDWLVSADDSEDSFHSRLTKELSDIGVEE